MTSLPKPPLGTSQTANWLRKLLACVAERTPKGGRNHRVQWDSDGWSIEQISNGGGSDVRTFHYKSQESEFIICRSWDGTTEGDTDIYIAKPPELWFSIDNETIRGDDIDYTYPADPEEQTRMATTTAGSPETQRVTRPYIVDDIIWAISARSFVDTTDVPGNKQVTLVDLNRAGRTWLAAASTSAP